MCIVFHEHSYNEAFSDGKGGNCVFLIQVPAVGTTLPYLENDGGGTVEQRQARARSAVMKRVLIIGASGGIGSALASALSAGGADVLGLSRSADGFDITDEQSVEDHLAQLDGPFDALIVASGALEIDGARPEKSIRAVQSKAMADQFAVNAIGPALVLRHAARLRPREGRSVCAVLSARVGSIGDNRIGGWTSYRAAKAAVNQIVHTTAIELGRTHPDLVCVSLHPGTVETPFTAKYLGRHPAVPAAEAAQNLLRVLEGLTPAQTGGFFDWAGKEVAW